MKFLDELNPPQRSAATTINGPLLILAGAGSGKTRVIAYRVAYMIAKGIAPEQILAVTFTNKAAGELKHRISHLLAKNNQPAGGVTAGTFHSIAARILRRHIRVLGYLPSFVIYDRGDQLGILKEVMKDLAINPKQFTPSGLLAGISRAKSDLQDTTHLRRANPGPWGEVLSTAFTKYQERLKGSNALDFDDLLELVVRIWRLKPEVLDAYQEQYKYVLVDEYQDTNPAQYTLIKMLAQKYRNLGVVGDDYQSIYAFRGADFRNILNFKKDYPEAKVVLLEQNYRSTKNILDAANKVIAQNQFKTDKTLWTDKPAGERITLAVLASEQAEAAYVVQEVQTRLAGGLAAHDCAVLFRTNAQSRALEEAFIKAGLAYDIVGTTRFYDRKEVKDVLSYLRLIENPADRVSFQRILNVPARGLGLVALKVLIPHRAAVVENRPLDDALKQALSVRQQGALKALMTHFGRWRKLVKTVAVTKLIGAVISESGYDKFLTDGTPDGEARLENIRELMSVAAENPDQDLTQFLEGVGLFSETDKIENKDRVQLLTMHAAKGLEFPVVWVTGFEEGLFPHYRALMSNAEMEEERRLCYVAITRAKVKLYLTRARRRSVFGQSQANPPSRFIYAIPTDLVEEPDTNDEPLWVD